MLAIWKVKSGIEIMPIMNSQSRRCFLLIFFFCSAFLSVQSIDSVFLLPSQCGTVQPADVGIIIRSNANENYTLDAENCTFVMTATTPSHRIRFAFNTGNGETGFLENPANSGTSFCPGASIEIFDGPNITSPSLTNQRCGEFNSDEIVSTGDTLTLLLISSDNATTVNFTAHYTSYTEVTDCGDDLPCSNGRCVSVDMRCDATRIDNCGDSSDNFAGPPGNCSSETTTTVAATTTAPTTTTATTTTTTAAPVASSNDGMVPVYIAIGIVAGALLVYLHWLLFKPRWLIWRVCWFGRYGCYRTCSNCLGRNAVDSTPSLGKMEANTDTANQRKTSPTSTPMEQSRQTVQQEYADGESPFVRGIAKENHIFTVSQGGSTAKIAA